MQVLHQGTIGWTEKSLHMNFIPMVLERPNKSPRRNLLDPLK